MNRRDLQNLESLFMLSALDNCHSKRRTAETIGASVDTVNKYIASLEAELGLRLVVCSERGCCLTPAGENILRRIRRMQDILFEIYAAKNSSDNAAQIVTIGMETGISANLFIDDIDRFFNRFNNIMLQAILLDRNTRGTTPPDIVLSHILPADENIVLQTVRKFPCKAFAAQSYLEKHGHPQDMNDLINNHRLVCKTYSRYHDEKYLDLLESARHVCYLSDSDHEVVDAARNGAGICILPVCLADSSLVCLNNLDWESSVTIYLFSSRRAIDNPVIGEVVAYFRELFEKR